MSSTETPDAGTATEGSDDPDPAPETDDAGEELLAELLATITDELGAAVVGSHLLPGDLWVRVTREAWLETAQFLRTGLGFAYFSFLSGIDWMPSPFGRDMDSQVDLTLEAEERKDPGPIEQGYAGGETRFQVFARVNDVVGLRAVTLKSDVPDDDLRIDSWVRVYAGANWHERECWEMYGITFEGHPGLRHIYLPGEFEGNPLRKDYPLLARRVKPWPGIVDVELMPDDPMPDDPMPDDPMPDDPMPDDPMPDDPISGEDQAEATDEEVDP